MSEIEHLNRSLRREDHDTVQSFNKAIVLELNRAKNDRDWAAFDRIVSPSFNTSFVRFYGGVEQFDLAWYKEKCAEYTTVWPDLHHEVYQLFADGDWVIARQHYTGTHVGEIMGVKPTGKTIDVHQHLQLLIKDGLIVDMFSTADLLSGIWGRLGVRPPLLDGAADS